MWTKKVGNQNTCIPSDNAQISDTVCSPVGTCSRRIHKITAYTTSIKLATCTFLYVESGLSSFRALGMKIEVGKFGILGITKKAARQPRGLNVPSMPRH